MSSSSSQAASASRSPSPITPSTPDSSDNIQTLPAEPISPSTVYWDESSPRFSNTAKEDGTNILSLDDLIQDYAYDDSSSPSLSTAGFSAAVSKVLHSSTSVPPSIPHFQPCMDLIPSAVTMVPPPATQPRKKNPSASQTVVYPPKDSCSNLAIMIPSIPEGGTKSRVETQVRVTVDLAYASATAGEQPSQYDRVGSWKWLRLPKGTATKKRTRKEGKIDPLVEDTLQLGVEITCASPPHSRVVCCSSCQGREAKRVARKLAQRVRPQRYDSDSPETTNATANGTTEPFNVVQFNCPEVLSFSSGTVVFPLRITCYCRHHRERVGFHVHFTMSDHTGRVVGTGTTYPIMITDDHKSTGANAKQSPPVDPDWLQVSGDAQEKTTLTKRKQSHTPEITFDQGKKRLKINPSMVNAPCRESQGISRRSSSGSLNSPSIFTSALPTRTTTPSQPASSGPPSQFGGTAPPSPRVSDRFIVQSPEVPLPSPSPLFLDVSEVPLPVQPLLNTVPLALAERDVSPSTFLSTAPPSPVAMSMPQYQLLQDPLASAPLPFMFFPDPPPMTPVPQPRIHRLIPSSGPITGGIEVTVLGSNFHPSLQLNCIFGDVVASSTQRWSDNTLVCILPPRASSGVVAVWFSGMQKEEDGTPPCLFTYTDESDRALMELALQEDAKSLAADSISLGLRSALHHMSTSSGLEQMVIDLLSLLNVQIDTPSRLHFAAFLDCPALPDKDARDHNGYTALHLASFVGAQGCAAVLLNAGADVEIVSVEGKTAQELAEFSFADLRAEGFYSEDENVPLQVVPSSPSDEDSPHIPEKSGKENNFVDEKQAATFMRKLQRTLARVQPKDGIMPNMPHLALPQLLQLPGMPVVPWGALPQIPTVFTVYVPWPASFRTSRGSDTDTDTNNAVPPKGKMRSLLTPQEWPLLEKYWLVQGSQAAMQIPDDEDESPPVYTPRAEDEGEPPVAESSIPTLERPVARPVGYDTGPVPDDREVNAYEYLPRNRKPRQIQNKEDRMLLLFWIPILLLALLWAFVHGVRIAVHSIRTAGPVRALLWL
ncbi:hypothetical protein EDB89DRAFT_1940657 [Lactarius sanguifluus]|nr:hypothetical protein EDB89DRAFT_1940657 [Lactarius sanguifluus]